MAQQTEEEKKAAAAKAQADADAKAKAEADAAAAKAPADAAAQAQADAVAAAGQQTAETPAPGLLGPPIQAPPDVTPNVTVAQVQAKNGTWSNVIEGK
jgi:hypothetical protein